MQKFLTLLIYHPELIVLRLLDFVSPIVPDKIFITLKYRLRMGYWFDITSPKTFSEKIQWLKLNDRHPIYTQMVDKLSAKNYVAKIVGQEYIIPTLGIWDTPEQIDWDVLPDQFVLKTTHGGGSCGVIIVLSKKDIDKKDIIKKLNKAIKQNLYATMREWPYKDVSKKIFAEQFIEKDIKDYKFFCFNGVPTFCQLIQNRASQETIDFYDSSWVHQDFIGLNPEAKHSLTQNIKPQKYDKMIEIAKLLSKGVRFLRVDLYENNDSIYFGEMTFYPYSGFGSFSPSIWNYKLGELINIGEN